jgi:hypothetical protein
MEDNMNVNILTSRLDMAEMPVEKLHTEKLVFKNGYCFKENKSSYNNKI